MGHRGAEVLGEGGAFGVHEGREAEPRAEAAQPIDEAIARVALTPRAGVLLLVERHAPPQLVAKILEHGDHVLPLRRRGRAFGEHRRDASAVRGLVPAERAPERRDSHAGFLRREDIAVRGVADPHELIARAIHEVVSGLRPVRVGAAAVGELPLARPR